MSSLIIDNDFMRCESCSKVCCLDCDILFECECNVENFEHYICEKCKYEYKCERCGTKYKALCGKPKDTILSKCDKCKIKTCDHLECKCRCYIDYKFTCVNCGCEINTQVNPEYCDTCLGPICMLCDMETAEDENKYICKNCRK